MGMFDVDTGIFYSFDENGQMQPEQLFWHGRIVKRKDCGSKFEFDELVRKKSGLFGWLIH